MEKDNEKVEWRIENKCPHHTTGFIEHVTNVSKTLKSLTDDVDGRAFMVFAMDRSKTDEEVGVAVVACGASLKKMTLLFRIAIERDLKIKTAMLMALTEANTGK